MAEKRNSRVRFLRSVRAIVDYWSNFAKSKGDAAQGVAFSIMALIDGSNVYNLSGYEVIDKETGQNVTEQGSELHEDL